VKISLFHSRVAAMLVMALLLPIIAACGGSSQTSEPTPALPTAAVSTPSQPTTTQPTEPPTPTEESGEPVQPTVPPSDEPITGPLSTPYLEYGVINHLYYTDRGRVLILTNNAGFDWVRQQIHWKDMEGPEPGNYAWGDFDAIVEDVANHNLKLLVSVVKSPDFYNETNGLPRDPKPLGDFLEALMKRYGNKIGAVEVWNEQNLARENGGRVTLEDAGHYVEVLAEAYRRIKAISPGTYVLAAPPSSTGFNREDVAVPDEDFYRAMYSYKNGMIKDYFDAQAVHPGGAANPPQYLYPDEPYTVPNCPPELGSCWTNDATHYFRHIENVRRFMVEEGVGDHQIWVTEFGWATANNTPGYEFGDFVTPEQQAQYTVDAMKWAHEKYRNPDGSSWVGVMFLWNMNFAVIWAGQGNPNHEEASFGLLNPDWSPRPVFDAVQGYLARVKSER
jgi:hypothetical protein